MLIGVSLGAFRWVAVAVPIDGLVWEPGQHIYFPAFICGIPEPPGWEPTLTPTPRTISHLYLDLYEREFRRLCKAYKIHISVKNMWPRDERGWYSIKYSSSRLHRSKDFRKQLYRCLEPQYFEIQYYTYKGFDLLAALQITSACCCYRIYGPERISTGHRKSKVRTDAVTLRRKPSKRNDKTVISIHPAFVAALASQKVAA